MDDERAARLLADERRRIEGLLAELGRDPADREAGDVLRDRDDGAEPLTAEGTDGVIADELRERLAAIARAEQRLAAGTYGRSIRSGEPIPDERLEADPAAELTVQEAQAAAALR